MRWPVLVLMLLACRSAGLQSSEWPQFQFDSANHGRSGGPAVEAPYKVRWIWWGENNVAYLADREIPIGGHPPPPAKETCGRLSFTMHGVVADGRVVFGDLDGKLFCLSVKDGSTVWKAQLGGAIIHASAICTVNGPVGRVVVTACHDGKLYGLAWEDGKVLWTANARKPFVTPVKVADGIAFAGSLDGKLYALQPTDGKVVWTFDAGAPIRQPCAIAGGKVFFGSEDMIFHALNVKDGNEIWKTSPGQMKGQSFRNTWPMVVGDRVMTFQILVDGMAEFVMEALLWHATPGSPVAKKPEERKRIQDWPKEREAILKWLSGDDTYAYAVEPPWSKTPGVRRGDKIDPRWLGGPFRKTFFVFTTAGDGKGGAVEPFQVPMGIVGGTGNSNMLAVDSQGRPVTYWRVSKATIMKGGTFGSAFTPDLSALDLKTGDRVPYPSGEGGGPGVELDNHHMLTSAGDYIYWFNPFRQARWIKLDGKGNPFGNISAVYKQHDGGGWSGDLVYFAGSEQAGRRGVDSHGAARTPCVIAEGALFLNELDIRALACFESRGK